MSNRFDYLPNTASVATWFGLYGRTLTDVPSYRNMIALVRKECAEARKDLSGWVLGALLDEVEVLEESLRQADALVERMEARLMELGVQPDPVAAAMVSDAARLLEAYGDDVLEAGVL